MYIIFTSSVTLIRHSLHKSDAWKQFITAGTAALWWTYVDKKNEVDEKEAINFPLLSVEINSEQAFLVYSIIATVLTVSCFILRLLSSSN